MGREGRGPGRGLATRAPAVTGRPTVAPCSPDLEARAKPGGAASRGGAAASAVLVAAMLVLASGLSAQEAARFQVGVHLGSLSHSLLGEVSGTLLGLGGPSGLEVDSDVEAESSTMFGVRLAGRLTPALVLRLRVARASTHMRLVARTGPAGAFTGAYTFGGLGAVGVWLVDADVAWTLRPIVSPVAPYVFAGVGGSKWSITGLEDVGRLPPLFESPVHLDAVSEYLPGAVLGVGVAVGPFGRATLELEVADHVTGDPLADDDFRLGTGFTGSGRAKDLVHNVSVTVGVRVAAGLAPSPRS